MEAKRVGDEIWSLMECKGFEESGYFVELEGQREEIIENGTSIAAIAATDTGSEKMDSRN